jgi:hypothetical protein
MPIAINTSLSGNPEELNQISALVRTKLSDLMFSLLASLLQLLTYYYVQTFVFIILFYLFSYKKCILADLYAIEQADAGTSGDFADRNVALTLKYAVI